MAERGAVVDARLSRRRRSIERARRRKILLRTTVAGALAASVWAALYSPVFEVTRVVVTGGRHTAAGDVADAAGLIGRANLLTFSVDDARERVEALPWVRSAEVERILPGTVRFRIVEREPRLQVVVADGRWLVDADGRVLEAADVADPVPLLLDTQAVALAPGVHLETREAKTALSVFRALPQDLRERLRSIQAPTPERVTIVLDGGVHVRYGTDDRLAAKNEVAAAVLRDLGSGAVPGTYLDVRVPTNPVVEPAPPPAPGVR